MRVLTIALCATGASAFTFMAPSPAALRRATRSLTVVSMSEVEIEPKTEDEVGVVEDDLLAPTSEGDDLPPMGAASFNPQDEAKLFVGNLNFNTGDEDMMTIFGEFGPVISAEHVADRFDPMRKRGFGFVVFETKEGAQAAVDALNGNELDGRTVRVEFFTPKPRMERGERPARPQRRNFGEENGRRVYVGNLDYRTDDSMLEEIFSEFGEVQSCSQLTEREDPSRKRGFGFATFANAEDANAAVDNLDGLEVDGRPLRVNIAQPRPERPSW